MKILLSAFACAPDPRTLDEETGWRWALALARGGRDVTVLTAARNREAVEAWLARNREVTIGFRYVADIGNGRFGNFVWQIAALFVLLRSGEWRDYDLIHHLTPGSIRRWSWLWVLPRPFVFGPASGGERAPLRFVSPMGAGPLVQELLWRVLLWLSFIDPVCIAMQARAARILVTTPETATALWPRFRGKAPATIAIGAPAARGESGGRSAVPVRLLFAAPLHYANGGDILADIAAEIESRGRRYDIVMLGSGQRRAAIEKKLKRIRHLRILATDEPTPAELTTLYRECDIAMFPGLRSASGAAVLDAMAHGLPVVCLDLGAPPMMVGDTGEIVATEGKNYQDLCRDFADAIVRLAEDPRRRLAVGQSARQRAQQLTWEAAVRTGYAAILERVGDR
jgi:glycosyltransferase involved in cell wall biosynthesis